MTRDEIEAEIVRVMDLTNLPRPEVAAAVARLCGEDVSDLVTTEPLTEADREWLGMTEPWSAIETLRTRRVNAVVRR